MFVIKHHPYQKIWLLELRNQ